MSGVIRTLLIANRGEIAVRIMQTARKLGMRTVAVFAEADRHALHVQTADASVCLGEGGASQTYLDKAKILAAMERSGADAVHPGYGFLSEDADFAEQVLTAGFIWVGPPVNAMTAMASKASAKQTLEPKGVPMIPGYHGADQSDEQLLAAAQTVGLPLLVKASAGGGGKGMKVVEHAEQLADAIASARREARNSFGDDRLLLERYLQTPRHIEVQILADQHGSVLSLFDRDCTVQRRHQKVIEEAPAPNLPDDVRQQMSLAAETCAREIGYVGAGTVEFIYENGEFFFLEMNTRLQVEHPVTERICGLDLVEWQLRIAQGEAMPDLKPSQPNGHAIEVRLYAEDPDNDFQPVVGRIGMLAFARGEGIRIDTGVESGAEVSPFFDPMLGKIIVHGSDRTAALNKLARVLAESQCFGLVTNLPFLRQLVRKDELHLLTVHTNWLDRHLAQLQRPALTTTPLWAALAQVVSEQSIASKAPWHKYAGWRMNGTARWQFAVSEQEQVLVEQRDGQWQVTLSGQSLTLTQLDWQADTEDSGRLHAEVDGLSVDWRVWFGDDGIWLDNGDRIEAVRWWRADKAHDHDGAAAGVVTAVLPGVVTAIYAQPGGHVQKGDKLLSFEAMKMETTLLAEVSGHLQQMPWQVGEQIAEGDVLYEITGESADD